MYKYKLGLSGSQGFHLHMTFLAGHFQGTQHTATALQDHNLSVTFQRNIIRAFCLNFSNFFLKRSPFFVVIFVVGIVKHKKAPQIGRSACETVTLPDGLESQVAGQASSNLVTDSSMVFFNVSGDSYLRVEHDLGDLICSFGRCFLRPCFFGTPSWMHGPCQANIENVLVSVQCATARVPQVGRPN